MATKRFHCSLGAAHRCWGRCRVLDGRVESFLQKVDGRASLVSMYLPALDLPSTSSLCKISPSSSLWAQPSSILISAFPLGIIPTTFSCIARKYWGEATRDEESRTNGGSLMKHGFVSLVFHSHLPYCRQAGVWPFGEEWVFEAMAEPMFPTGLAVSVAGGEVGSKGALGFYPGAA